jgi:BioD-like phosphotransacetylase family protein
MTRLVLDAGAFIGFEKRNQTVMALLQAARESGTDLVTSAPIIGEVWRNSRTQAELARFLRSVDIKIPTALAAREAGELLGATRTDDVVDALLANLCEHTDVLITSDPVDLKLLTDSNKSRPKIVVV